MPFRLVIEEAIASRAISVVDTSGGSMPSSFSYRQGQFSLTARRQRCRYR
jgi:hypothetical protein